MALRDVASRDTNAPDRRRLRVANGCPCSVKGEAYYERKGQFRQSGEAGRVGYSKRGLLASTGARRGRTQRPSADRRYRLQTPLTPMALPKRVRTLRRIIKTFARGVGAGNAIGPLGRISIHFTQWRNGLFRA